MKKYMPLVLILMMFIVILGFSSQDAVTSDQVSGKFVYIISEFLGYFGDTFYTTDKINGIIRKLAHFTEYLVFAVIILVALDNIINKYWFSLMGSLTVCVAVATIDELFQKLSYGRTSNIFDVLIDCSGAFVGLSVITFFLLLTTRFEVKISKQT